MSKRSPRYRRCRPRRSGYRVGPTSDQHRTGVNSPRITARLIRRAYYQGVVHRADRHRPTDRRRDREIPGCITAVRAPRLNLQERWGDPMTDVEQAGAGDPYLTWDTSYVLGALSPSERRDFESAPTDLRAAAACGRRADREDALLAMVDLDEWRRSASGCRSTAAPRVRDQVLDRVRSTQRHRSRW